MSDSFKLQQDEGIEKTHQTPLGVDAVDLDISLLGKEGPKMNVGIVGFGPSGIIAAIALSKSGH